MKKNEANFMVCFIIHLEIEKKYGKNYIKFLNKYLEKKNFELHILMKMVHKIWSIWGTITVGGCVAHQQLLQQSRTTTQQVTK
jgi:hypothetical protein